MKNTDQKIQSLADLNLTAIEYKFLDALLSGLYAEPGFSDMDVSDIVAATDLSMPQARGVMASLKKAGVIDTDADYKNGETGAPLIQLNPAYYCIHPDSEWQEAGAEHAHKAKPVRMTKRRFLAEFGVKAQGRRKQSITDRRIVKAISPVIAVAIAERYAEQNETTMLRVFQIDEALKAKALTA